VQELAARGVILGVFEDIELEEASVHMVPGDYLVLYTDGVTEAMDLNRDPFGEDRLRRLLAGRSELTAQTVLGSVVDAVREFTGDASQTDDLTLIVIRRCP
jgi:sigma-B regulation protein RsbU (phosphoserine phosphatase)